MKRSHNNSGYSAKRSYRLPAAGLIAVALCLSACAGTQLPPIDDAYYSAELEAPAAPNTAIAPGTTNSAGPTNTSATPGTPNPASSPAFEYTNIQDTTVTIRIK